MDTPTIDKPAQIEVLVDNIPSEIRQLPRWVTWDWIWSAKQEKWTKPPLQANKFPASSTDPKTWTRFDIAYMIGRNRAGVGFMLGADVGIVGIDLDKCRDPITGHIKPLQAEIIKQLNTYAEVSPSGTGVKLLCRGNLPERCRKANHELGIEIYCDKRYFTITGHVLESAPKHINHCQSQIDELINKFMGDQQSLPRPEFNTEEEEIELAKSALQSLDSSLADGYTDWLMIGMALHAISPYLLDDWDRWSASSAKYAAGECAKKWSTFDGRGVGPGTLYHFAKIRGWTPPRGWKKPKVTRAITAIENYHREVQEAKDGSERIVKIPHTQPQIVDSVFELFDNWPKRIDEQLFAKTDQTIEFLPNSSHLFSWMQERKTVVWGKGDEMVSKEELYISLMRRAERFNDIQDSPHFPPIEGVYYCCEFPKPGDGSHLEGMLDFFSPATPEDRQLIKAAIATTFWGGPPGQRPAFLISAAIGSGQGTGKTTLATMIGNLTGGAYDFSAGMEAEEIKKQLLSGKDPTKRRVVFLDNVKKAKFSDQGIEALITTSNISGHQMYNGASSKPNLMVWFVTMNGPSLSRDLAQRCVNIMLKRPAHSGDWYDRASKFIKQNRDKIVADVAGFFNKDRQPVEYPSRWGLWEREVVSRLDNHEDVLRVVQSRESLNDDDFQQANAIEEFVSEKIKEAGYEHPIRVHISNERMGKWIDSALGEEDGGYRGWKHTKSLMSRLETSGLLMYIYKNPSRTYGRGWIYSTTGEDIPTRYDLEQRVF